MSSTQRLQTRRVGFGRSGVVLRSEAPEVVADVDAAFRQLLVPEGVPLDEAATLEVRRQDGGYALHVDGAPAAAAAVLADLLHPLRHEVIRRLVEARPDLLWLHAGAVARGGEAVLLPAASGSGKSTLVLGLCARGWTYLSDDLAPLDPCGGTVHPFPLTPVVRRGGGRALPPEALHTLPRQRVELDAFRYGRGGAPVRALLFPSFRPEQPEEVVPFSSARAVMEMLQRCVNFEHFTGDALRLLAGLAAQVPAYRLCYRDGARASALVDEMAGRGALHNGAPAPRAA